MEKFQPTSQSIQQQSSFFSFDGLANAALKVGQIVLGSCCFSPESQGDTKASSPTSQTYSMVTPTFETTSEFVNVQGSKGELDDSSSDEEEETVEEIPAGYIPVPAITTEQVQQVEVVQLHAEFERLTAKVEELRSKKGNDYFKALGNHEAARLSPARSTVGQYNQAIRTLNLLINRAEKNA